jgi:CRISPR/Cas system CMR-associated protein Cmr5 small subunit
MLRKVEYLIPAALRAVDAELKPIYTQIPAAYQSAASGFAVTLLQMGLLPTLAVYADRDNNAAIKRDVFLSTLVAIIKDDVSKYGGKENLSKAPNELLRYMAAKERTREQRDTFMKHLLQASVAFKLVIRTYELKKD